jgi:hypothetical protein
MAGIEAPVLSLKVLLEAECQQINPLQVQLRHLRGVLDARHSVLRCVVRERGEKGAAISSVGGVDE